MLTLTSLDRSLVKAKAGRLVFYWLLMQAINMLRRAWMDLRNLGLGTSPLALKQTSQTVNTQKGWH